MTPGDEGFRLDENAYPAVRLRLANEIHRRAYHDAGIEVSPEDPDAPELERRFSIATPHCLRGDRHLGTLAWHNGDWPGGARHAYFTGWPELVTDAFKRLGMANIRTRKHKGCFHRRGKARHDLIFAIGTELVLGAPSEAEARIWAWRAGSADNLIAEFMVAEDLSTVGKPARHLAVSCCGVRVVVMRSDGRAGTSAGALNIDDLWWSGSDLAKIADEILAISGHRHSEGDAAW